MDQDDAQKVRKFRHLFLDAEGTLYIPRNGKSRWEFWANPSPEAAVEFFELDRGVKETLEQLRSQVDTLCLVSRNPEDILGALLDRFGIRHLFDDIMLNGDKGKQIAHYLSKRGLRRDESVMVGDMPVLDLYPVRRLGIEAILVDRVYNSWAKATRIRGVSDLPCWLKIADLAEEMGLHRAYTSSLDDFDAASGGSFRTQNRTRVTTKRLIAVPSA
jgi:phosphoglycolate phosphatase-like HAD superfamily hydrolase